MIYNVIQLTVQLQPAFLLAGTIVQTFLKAIGRRHILYSEAVLRQKSDSCCPPFRQNSEVFQKRKVLAKAI